MNAMINMQFDLIRLEIIKSLEDNLGKVNYTKIEVDNYIKEILSQRIEPQYIKELSFDTELKVNTIWINAKNLYTLLTLNGIKVNFENVKDKNEYKTIYGTFLIEKDQCRFIPLKPIEFIKLEIDVNKNCSNCRYRKLSVELEPCNICKDTSNWQKI